jgi:hypothetical protein
MISRHVWKRWAREQRRAGVAGARSITGGRRRLAYRRQWSDPLVIGLLVFVVAIVALVAYAASAAAAPVIERERDPAVHLARWAEVAEAHWDERPACGRVVARFAPLQPPLIGWWSEDRPCEVLVRRYVALRFWPHLLCTTVVHEYGHAIGRDHVEGRLDVMNDHVLPDWAIPRLVPGCRERTRCSRVRRGLVRCRRAVAGVTSDVWLEGRNR